MNDRTNSKKHSPIFIGKWGIMARFTKEDAREIMRKCGIEMINASMTDEVKKQKEIEEYNKHIDGLDIEAYLRGE